MTLSQSNDNSNYVLIDKQTHEELRRNIDDYKRLIVDFEKVKSDLEVAKKDSQLDNDKLLHYQRQIVDLQDKILKLNQQVQTLTEKLDNANMALLEKSKLYDDLKRIHYRDQAKIYKMNGYKNRFQTQGLVIGFLAVTVVILLGEQH